MSFFEKETYCLRNIHLKLGSKIHIRDFIYAKRLFQNSAYTSKFAFLATNRIVKALSPEYSRKDITLVGYGYYSELLVSRIEQMLNGRLSGGNINHIIVNHEEDIQYSFHLKKVYHESNISTLRKKEQIYIVIVPISSTLTTAIKLENEFYRDLTKHLNSLKLDENIEAVLKDFTQKISFTAVPFQTMVLVGHGLIEDTCDVDGKVTVEPVQTFWKKIDIENKTITTINIKDGTERNNQYYSYIPSEWYDIFKCNYCFPAKITDEKPLFRTDKVSVTPELIHDNPKWPDPHSHDVFFDLKSENLSVIGPYLNHDMINYGHFEGQGKHYRYYFKYDKVLEKNRKGISAWAKHIGKDFYAIGTNDKLLIITPNKNSNGEFVHTINSIIFNDRANIISFDPYHEEYSNFIRFFQNQINAADYIFYADNLLATGQTFHAIIKIFRQIREHSKNEENAQIFSLFTLINRLNIKDTTAIKNEIFHLEGKEYPFRNIYTYMAINFPVMPLKFTSKKNIDDCFLCKEKEKYKQLINECSLDVTQKYIRDYDLKKLEFSSKYDIQKTVKTTNGLHKKILRLFISHLIYKLSYRSLEIENVEDSKQISLFPSATLSFDELIALEQFDDFIDKLQKYNNSALGKYFGETSSVVDLKASVFKVLSEPPFIHHKTIRQSVFGWLLKEIHKYFDSSYVTLISKMKSKEQVPGASIRGLQYLKLIIKCLTKLNSNYIISEYFLRKITELISYEHIYEKKYQEELNKPLALRIYILACIKEVSLYDEPKSINLERNISKLEAKFNEQTCERFFESLLLENTSIIQRALKSTEAAFDESKYNYTNYFFDKIDKCSQGLIENLDKQKDNYAVFKVLIQYIKNNQEDFDVSFNDKALSTFVYTLLLYRYLTISCKEPNKVCFSEEIEVNDFEPKAEYLLELLSRILKIDQKTGGGFILYKYSNSKEVKNDDTNFTVISNLTLNGTETSHELLQKNSFTKKMFNGFPFDVCLNEQEHEKSYFWTGLGLYRSQENSTWQLQNGDVYCSKDKCLESCQDNCTPECRVGNSKSLNRYYFFRITKWDKIKKRHLPIAVIVFYDKNYDIFDVSNVRYAFAIKSKIADFIESNFSNDTFKSWMEGKKELKAQEEAIQKKNKSIRNFNHNVVSRVFGQLQKYDSRAIKQGQDVEDITDSYIVGANVLISNLFSLLLEGQKVGFNKNDPTASQTRIVFNTSFKKILAHLVRSELGVKDPSNCVLDIETAVLPHNKFGTYSLRSFIVLHILNTKTHMPPGNSCCKFTLHVSRKNIEIRSYFKHKIMLAEYDEFRSKKKLIEEKNIMAIESTSLISMKAYFEQIQCVFEFDFNIVHDNNYFFVKIIGR